MYCVIVVEHGFDNWENRCPDTYENKMAIVGKSMEEIKQKAQEYIKSLESKRKKYLGYNDKEYPQYEIKEINCMCVGYVPSELVALIFDVCGNNEARKLENDLDGDKWRYIMPETVKTIKGESK